MFWAIQDPNTGCLGPWHLLKGLIGLSFLLRSTNDLEPSSMADLHRLGSELQETLNDLQLRKQRLQKATRDLERIGSDLCAKLGELQQLGKELCRQEADVQQREEGHQRRQRLIQTAIAALHSAVQTPCRSSPVHLKVVLTDLPEEMLREVAAAGGFRTRALMAATCRPLRDAVRTMTWPRGVPCALPTDRPTYLTGQVTVVGGEIVGVPRDTYTGGTVRGSPGNRYLFVRGAGTVVRMEGTRLRGVGLSISDGARVELIDCCTIEDPPNDGIRVVGHGSSVDAEGGEITGALGYGVGIWYGGKARLRGVTVARKGYHGIYCSDAGSRCDAEGVKVQTCAGRGVAAYHGATVTLTSVEAKNNDGGSLYSCGQGARIEVLDGCDLAGVAPGTDLSQFCAHGGTILWG